MQKLTQKLQSIKIRLKFRLYQFKLEIIVYGISLLYAILIGQLLNAIVLFISFNTIRPATPITFHFSKVNTCIKVSVIMFVCTITQFLVIPTNVTYCGGILLALAICLALYKIEYALIKNKLRFNLDMCTKEELVYCCKLLRYNSFKTEIAVKMFIEKLSNEEVYNWLCETNQYLAYDTVTTYRYRMRKALKELEK